MLKKYLEDRSGQFAIMFAVASTVLLISVGVAVDIQGVTKGRKRLQDMTDSAVLAAAASREDKIGALKQIAEDSMDGNNNLNWVINTHTTLSGDDIVRVEASTSYSAQLLGIVGVSEIPITVASEAPLPKEVPLNIALVLDSTGSMSGANMTALKSASKTLLNAFDQADPGVIQAAVIPYNRYVNIGLANRTKPWMDVPDDTSTTGTETCYMTQDLVDSSLCTTTSTPSTCYNDSGPYSCTTSSTSCPPEAYGPEYEYCYTPTYTDTWHGCVGSRPDPLHKKAAYQGDKFPGIMDVTCGTEILDLTDNLAAVEAHIDSLSASGNTYIPAGLAWGWRALDPNLPLGNLSNSQTDRKRALILMTDGANTVYLSAPNHNNDSAQTNTAATDALTLELCQSIKDDGIDLYSVAYKLGSGNAAAEQMVKDCATNQTMFFSADDQAELEKAFENIAASLFEVRLSK